MKTIIKGMFVILMTMAMVFIYMPWSDMSAFAEASIENSAATDTGTDTLSTQANTSSGEFAGGTGTQEDPYLVSTKEQLDAVRNDLTKSYKLTSDIEFTSDDFTEGGEFYNEGNCFEPIADNLSEAFEGTFDGNGHIIKGLVIKKTGGLNIGLFGTNRGTIKRLVLVDNTINNGSNVGQIVGDNLGTISDCHNKDNFVISCPSAVGGIAGDNSGTINDCSNSGNIDSTGASLSGGLGGIVGINSGTVDNCMNSGTVSGVMGLNTGGIVGSGDTTTSGGIVSNCYNKGAIDGACVGGIIGYNNNKTTLCCNAGSVTAESTYEVKAGGIAGGNSYVYGGNIGEITNCYNIASVKADGSVKSSDGYNAYSGGIVGVGGDVKNCYNTGNISADEPSYGSSTMANAGGIAGKNDSITNCYNTGTLYARSYYGIANAAGIAGVGGTINNSYNIGSVSSRGRENANADSIVTSGVTTNSSNNYYLSGGKSKYGKALTNTQMKSQNINGFDFDKDWEIRADWHYGYPVLRTVPNADDQKNILTDTNIKSAVISSSDFTYSGSVKTPSVEVKDVYGNRLVEGTDYIVIYSNGRKNVGRYTVTVKGAGRYTGTITKTFTISPKRVGVSRLVRGKRCFVAGWSRISPQVTGYQIYYSTNSRFRSGNKIATITGYRTTTRTVSSLKARTRYYVKMRTYTIVGKTRYYSGWSSVKAVVTK